MNQIIWGSRGKKIYEPASSDKKLDAEGSSSCWAEEENERISLPVGSSSAFPYRTKNPQSMFQLISERLSESFELMSETRETRSGKVEDEQSWDEADFGWRTSLTSYPNLPQISLEKSISPFSRMPNILTRKFFTKTEHKRGVLELHRRLETKPREESEIVLSM